MNTLTIALAAGIAAVLVAVLVTWLILKSRYNRVENDLIAARGEIQSLKELRENDAVHAAAVQQTLRESHEAGVATLKQAHEEALKQQIAAIRAEMTAETERLLKQREEQLSRKAEETFKNLTGSLDKDLREMRASFEAQNKTQTESSATLREQLAQAVRHLADQTRDIGTKADNLASALKGQNKMAGCWGETILYNMLIAEGMVEGRDFDKEETLRDALGLLVLNEDSGRRMRPDFILHYPDKTELIVDAKVSLDAYSDWSAAEEGPDKDDAARRNLAAIREQVRSLSGKRYQDYVREGFRTLDYVVMFIPNYGALQLDKSLAPDLFREAYNQGVLLTTEETLMPFLRMIRIAWTNYDQARNQEKIVKAAQTMVDRVADFAEAHARMGAKLEDALDYYRKCDLKLKDGGPSILTSANQLVRLGIPRNPKKPLPAVEE